MSLPVEKFDRIFSEWIRIRHADGNGWSHCYICGKPSYWKYLQNGHFIDRVNMSLRFDEINCQACCITCNVIKNGNLKKYEKKLKAEFGVEAVENLKKKAKEVYKYTQSEMNEKIAYYTKLVNDKKKST